MTEFAATETKRQFAIQKASVLAQKSKERATAKDTTEFVKITKDKLKFQINALKAEYKMINDLAVLTDQQKLETLFRLIDNNHDGEINAVELADGLRKVKGDVGFNESIRMAMKRVATFDTDHDGKLNLEEFGNYIHSFASELGSTFHEVSEMLVMTALFSKTGNTKEENEMASRSSQEIDREVLKAVAATKEDSERQNVKTRMQALFDLFDADGNGSVDFKEVVVGMYKITQDVDGASKAAVNALLMFDAEGSRSLNFDQFSRFIINVVVSVPEVSFDDMADLITQSASEGPDEGYSVEVIADMFTLDSSMKYVMDLSKATQEEVDKLKGAELGRVNKLFDLWDLDSDGEIDLSELALGMRKFEETTSLETTAEESSKVMKDFDTNNDQKLDRNEFALFVARFSTALDADIHEMVDFMIVTTAMKENSETEKKYIKSIGESDIYYWE